MKKEDYKKGDWVVFSMDEDEYTMQIVSIHGEEVDLRDDSIIALATLDSIRPWTIQDAKIGDVLEFGDHGRLVIGVVSYVNTRNGKVDVCCLLEKDKFKVGNYYTLDTIKPHPATEEQRKLLFSKMKEAGYKWNKDKQKLEMINQRLHKRIYISGPISGYPIGERRTAFKAVEMYLDSLGYDAINPMENGLPAEATTHEHMKRDIDLLMTCDYIYMMRRWTHSKGCKVEFDVATAIGLPVLFEESGKLIEFE